MSTGVRGLILEGVPCAGKTTLLQRLRVQPALLERQSLLVLSEHYTERAIERQRHLTAERYEQLMYRLLAAIEPLRVLTVESDVLRDREDLHLRFVLERFHLTNIVRHAGGDLDMLRRVEAMMRFYQPTTVLLTVTPATLQQRLAHSLETRNTAWQEHFQTLGADLAQVTATLLEWQEAYLRAAAACSLPTHVVPADDGDAALAAVTALCR